MEAIIFSFSDNIASMSPLSLLRWGILDGNLSVAAF
jgi:hypothetical protein